VDWIFCFSHHENFLLLGARKKIDGFSFLCDSLCYHAKEPTMTTRNYWVVKGKKDLFFPLDGDLQNMLIPGTVQPWGTKKPPKELKTGDAIFFWSGSPDLFLIGLGEVTRPNYEYNAFGHKLSELKYLTNPFSPPGKLNIAMLRADPVLGGPTPEKWSSFLKAGPTATFFLLPMNHAKRLAELIKNQYGKTPEVSSTFSAWNI
jgi:hypothetical protein